MYYEDILRAFHRARVRYLIAGGVAVNLYGVPRFTRDLDILIDPSPLNLKKLERVLRRLGYRPRAPVRLEEFLHRDNWKRWKREKGMLAFSLHHPDRPYEEVDLLTDPPFTFTHAEKHGITLRQGNFRLRLVGLDDLMRMKRKAGRAQDLADIESLSKVRRLR